MKTFVNDKDKFMKDLNDTIEHSVSQGLPLTKVELDPAEWTYFVEARTTTVDGVIHQDWEDKITSDGFEVYRGVRVERGANQ